MSVPRVRFSAGCVVALFFCLLLSRGGLAGVNARVLFQVKNTSTVFAGQVQQEGADVRLLELGKPIEREMAGGESHSYQLTIAAGQYALVVLEQKRFDVVIKLFAPDGKLITTVDNPNGTQGAEPVHITAEATGSYRLEVVSLEKGAQPGRYEAKLVELRPATQQDRDRLAARRAFDEGDRLREEVSTPDALETAIKKSEEALTLYRGIGDRIEQISVLISMGNTYWVRAEHQKALERFDQASRIAQSLGDKQRQAVAVERAAILYQLMGELDKALQFGEEALHLYQATGEKRKEVEMLGNIPRVYSMLGEQEKARAYFEQLVRLYQALGDKHQEAITFRDIGNSYNLQGELQKELEYSMKALAIWQLVGNKQQEAIEQSLAGNRYASLGEKQKALDHTAQALLLQPAIIEDKLREAALLHNVGLTYYKLGEFEKALAYFKEPLRLWQTNGRKRNEAVTLKHIASAQRDLGRLAEAQASIEKSIALVEDLRNRAGSPQLQASFLSTLFNFYEFYGDLMMRLHAINPKAGHDLTALAFTEQVKARGLIALLTKARVDLRPGVGNSRLTALTEPQPLVVKEIQQQLDGNTILLEYELGDERSYLWAVTVDGVLSYQLPPRAEVEAQARRVYQLLIARQPAPGLTDAQQRAREVAADAEYQTQATILSKMLLAPVAAQLGTKRLLIVADGALQYLPFAALPAPTSQGTETRADFRPLILDHEIVSLPSASVLAVLRRELADRKPATKTVAVLADPVFSPDDARVKQRLASTRNPGTTQKPQAQTATSSDRSSTLGRALRSVRGEDERAGLQRLLFSRDEAEAILSAVRPRQSGLEALDFRANRKMAMSDELGQYRIIHFSTHGLLDSRHPELSGLVLSLVDEAGQPQEGFLQLNEIYNLRLNADLVVLSACQTGLGKAVSGEGLIGLTRGFMYAGTPRVIASLWQVDDAATAELMKRFYRGVLQEKLPPAAALRAAQIEMLKKRNWQSPYYWGAFVLQGEWK
ncbi:MAG TPA: CHAT domain-containing tetratricopeptide repeat protein [Pyrinomonadaceae bacterium]